MPRAPRVRTQLAHGHREGRVLIQDAKGTEATEPRLARFCSPRAKVHLHVRPPRPPPPCCSRHAPPRVDASVSWAGRVCRLGSGASRSPFASSGAAEGDGWSGCHGQCPPAAPQPLPAHAQQARRRVDGVVERGDGAPVDRADLRAVDHTLTRTHTHDREALANAPPTCRHIRTRPLSRKKNGSLSRRKTAPSPDGKTAGTASARTCRWSCRLRPTPGSSCLVGMPCGASSAVTPTPDSSNSWGEPTAPALKITSHLTPRLAQLLSFVTGPRLAQGDLSQNEANAWERGGVATARASHRTALEL
jgi:hypothetical protein